jgi:hypothetical protein
MRSGVIRILAFFSFESNLNSFEILIMRPIETSGGTTSFFKNPHITCPPDDVYVDAWKAFLELD